MIKQMWRRENSCDTEREKNAPCASPIVVCSHNAKFFFELNLLTATLREAAAAAAAS